MSYSQNSLRYNLTCHRVHSALMLRFLEIGGRNEVNKNWKWFLPNLSQAIFVKEECLQTSWKYLILKPALTEGLKAMSFWDLASRNWKQSGVSLAWFWRNIIFSDTQPRDVQLVAGELSITVLAGLPYTPGGWIFPYAWPLKKTERWWQK